MKRNPKDLSTEEKAEIRGFRKGRLMGLTDVWSALRDAPDGPMMDAMKIVQKMMKEMDSGDPGTGNG